MTTNEDAAAQTDINPQKQAAMKVATLLARPDAIDIENWKPADFFQPWEIFDGLIVGHYDPAFDACAIQVLMEIESGVKHRHDLGAHMFRELLCGFDLCEYGTSSRTCFATIDFKPLLPALIKKWKHYARIDWGEDVWLDEEATQ